MPASRPLIFDVGAHRGEDAEFYLRKGFRVVAVEANPALCEEIRSNLKEFVASGYLEVVNVAVATSTHEEVDLFINDRISEFTTTNPDFVARNLKIGAGAVRRIRVRAASLASLIDTYGLPYYCKIDIEGCDLDALKSLKDISGRPKFISIESEKRSWAKLLEEFLTFRGLGYTDYKIVDQSLVEMQICPEPPREGQYAEQSFKRDSSGLFGNELPGDWLDFFDAIDRYKEIFRGYFLNGDYGILQPPAQSRRWLSRRRSDTNLDTLPPASWHDTHATY